MYQQPLRQEQQPQPQAIYQPQPFQPFQPFKPQSPPLQMQGKPTQPFA